MLHATRATPWRAGPTLQHQQETRPADAKLGRKVSIPCSLIAKRPDVTHGTWLSSPEPMLPREHRLALPARLRSPAGRVRQDASRLEQADAQPLRPADQDGMVARISQTGAKSGAHLIGSTTRLFSALNTFHRQVRTNSRDARRSLT